ncbi:thiamine biosynthesis protein ThiF [Sphingomonas sp. Leaf231]|uniref:ThiF family adenylyltransferase n=1 Tax=Sphingomonas sp. Leaf231 TaxID=1736301 RepID=UPI0006FC358B|nr:ThiF family adenylyltransferase [Sphingomonas sp. Leaf231]KQN92724.1 thiamine biosynthesis protein ThiF [Sphingomonas sp. Leaf231]
MMPRTSIAMAGVQHRALRAHLFPGDGLEAAAILLCARGPGHRSRYVVREVMLVPHADCFQRTPDFVSWPGAWLERAIDQGERDGLALILAHSHPGGLLGFSDRDDTSDRITVSSLFQAYGRAHGSAIMVPDGTVLPRLYDPDMAVRPVDLVTVVGDDIVFQLAGAPKRAPAFTSGMTDVLARLSAVVIGVSGTGTVVAEQAARLGFGRVILIDFDRIERRNLNRILNSTRADAAAELLKVAAFARAITEYRGPDVAIPVPASIDTRDAVIAAAQGDVLFSCVDTLHARQIADLMASAFVMPLFDMGVTIPARTDTLGEVSIIDAVGRIDYVQPGGSSLRTRGVYTPKTLRAEYLADVAPEAHAIELAAGYIDGAVEQAPSVISLNMRAASAAMNEFILRAFPFRLDPNRGYARTRFSLAGGDEDHFDEDDFAVGSDKLLGRGGTEPLLRLPRLGVPE